MRLTILFFLLCCCHLLGHEPIDIVYTWVDGSDHAWAAKRDFYKNRDKPSCGEGLSASRFHEKNELKYSLRSIHSFAPFVRHIFIVTDGQHPKWLKKHPKVTVISHQDIFRWKEYLPVFNSEAIEANLHRIPDLSERYVYFNDDVFLGKPVTPNDFFTSDGKIKFFESTRTIPNVLTPPYGPIAQRAWNTSQEVKARYGKDITMRFLQHTPHVMLKSVVQDAEKEFPHMFKKTSADRFRSPNTYRITCCLVQYVGLCTGRAKPCSAQERTAFLTAIPEADSRRLQSLLEQRPTFFCLQDERRRKPSRESDAVFVDFFETYFPTKAPWEK